jgi:hypothetical protein
MGGRWHQINGRIHVFLWKREWESLIRYRFFCALENHQQHQISYIILRGCWCHIIVLNVHALTEDKIVYVKDSLCEELQCLFDKFPKYHITILLGEITAKVGRKDMFKLTIGNKFKQN